ncbi:MAG: RNA polymerase sigma factor [Bacteroidota bacterium]
MKHLHIEKNDHQLWEEFVLGDNKALGTLFSLHHREVMLSALGLCRDKDAAADLVQDAYLKILEKQEQFAQNPIVLTSFTALVAKFMSNLWLSNFRKEKRRQEILEEEVKPHISQTILVDKSFDLEAYLQAWRRVPNTNHRRILAFVYRGYKNADIAERLQRTDKWVRDNRYHAKKSFQRILKEEGLIDFL